MNKFKLNFTFNEINNNYLLTTTSKRNIGLYLLQIIRNIEISYIYLIYIYDLIISIEKVLYNFCDPYVFGKCNDIFSIQKYLDYC